MSSKQTAKRKIDYPMGSISSGTMRPEDLIPTFCSELESLARRNDVGVSAKTRKAHRALVREIESRMEVNNQNVDPSIDDNDEEYFDSENADWDLESLTNALGTYAAPYFYFGSHPGGGSDYGFWLSESWDEDFESIVMPFSRKPESDDIPNSIKVNDLADVPAWFRGEVVEINDHGNITLYVKTSRGLREIWGVV